MLQYAGPIIKGAACDDPADRDSLQGRVSTGKNRGQQESTMISHTLREARQIEEAFEKRITKNQRPLFHLTPRTGWMNDPNGFTYYKGKYHLFYQYNPYDSHWGSMHWGHAVSEDLLRWEYAPAALAPDEYYDKDGVFSGSSAVLPDGRLLIAYTGVMEITGEDGEKTCLQTQCLAVGDGTDFVKIRENPVITSDMIPEGGSIHDFRDPKLWIAPDGTYRMLVANRPADNSGQLLLYRSRDAFHWEYRKVFAENRNRFGKMWECPDFFELDGKGVLLVSPQDMLPSGFEYHNGNGTVCMIGSYDPASETFAAETDQAVDYGIDFYAMQTTLSPDGRRIMIGWMQNWDTIGIHDANARWFGQMSLPRELRIRNGKLFQYPVRELDHYRKNKVEYERIKVPGSGIITPAHSKPGDVTRGLCLPGVFGRCVDMEITVTRAEEEIYNKFTVSLAANDECYTDVSFRPKESIVKIDRKFSGFRRAGIHQRRAHVEMQDDQIRFRIILDRFSMEVFINDGSKVMSVTLATEQSADGIYFTCDKDVIIHVRKYDLDFDEPGDGHR